MVAIKIYIYRKGGFIQNYVVARFQIWYTKYDWVYWPFGRFKGQGRTWPRAGMVAVSYTHLTLPTICSV